MRGSPPRSPGSAPRGCGGAGGCGSPSAGVPGQEQSFQLRAEHLRCAGWEAIEEAKHPRGAEWRPDELSAQEEPKHSPAPGRAAGLTRAFTYLGVPSAVPLPPALTSYGSAFRGQPIAVHSVCKRAAPACTGAAAGMGDEGCRDMGSTITCPEEVSSVPPPMGCRQPWGCRWLPVVHGHPGAARSHRVQTSCPWSCQPFPVPRLRPQPSPESCTNPLLSATEAARPRLSPWSCHIPAARRAPRLGRRQVSPVEHSPAIPSHGDDQASETVGLSHFRSSRGYRLPLPGPQQLWDTLPWGRRKGFGLPGKGTRCSPGPSPPPSLTSPSVLSLSSKDKWLLLKNRVINFPPN